MSMNSSEEFVMELMRRLLKSLEETRIERSRADQAENANLNLKHQLEEVKRKLAETVKQRQESPENQREQTSLVDMVAQDSTKNTHSELSHSEDCRLDSESPMSQTKKLNPGLNMTIDAIDQELLNAREEFERSESRRNDCESKLKKALKEISDLKLKLQVTERKLLDKEKALELIESDKIECGLRMEEMDELNSELKMNLEAKERKLSEVSAVMQQLKLDQEISKTKMAQISKENLELKIKLAEFERGSLQWQRYLNSGEIY